MYSTKCLFVFPAIALMVFSGSYTADASIVVDGTRVIYHAEKKETTVSLKNNNPAPVLIQSWIDTGDSKVSPDQMRVPFLITPPINRVDAGKGQSLRISYIGTSTLPTDRESVFWLNILEVPAKDKNLSEDRNRLTISFRTRIKLFYRPEGLAGDPTEAAKKLHWTLKNNDIVVDNISKYYVSLVSIHYGEANLKGQIHARMIVPGEQQTYRANEPIVHDIKKLQYDVIDDYGAVRTYRPEYSAE
ncbi:fimbrial biogenesis chaperone [Escherichia albertii]|uniref:fimbrial biogenesis chaperone n=1 Tax=Escherichia albertii TaxID=208962 RepID=UPI0011E9E43A|nr:fimbria/pilus periplasmic chaperone [Escherichia albertii]